MSRAAYSLILILSLGVLTGAQNIDPYPRMSGDERLRQSCQIRGQVKVANGGTLPPLGIGSIKLRCDGAWRATTPRFYGKPGNFQISDLRPARCEVIVDVPGYKPVSRSADLTNVPVAFVEFVLVADSTTAKVPLPVLPTAKVPDPAVTVPENARQSLELGKQALANGQPETSLQLLMQAVSEYPDYVEAYLLMGAAYSSEKKWYAARTALKKALELNPTEVKAYIGLGMVANEAENFREAEEYLLKAIELASDSANAQLELGRAYFGQQQWSLAKDHIAKAIELGPTSAEPHVEMGNVLLHERDAQGALKEFQKALRLDPEGPLSGPTRQMIDRIENALKQATNQKP